MLAGVPVDSIKGEDISEAVDLMVNSKEHCYIVFLSIFDLFMAKFSEKKLSELNNAAFIVPVSRSIIFGAEFLKKPDLNFFIEFDFVIKLMSGIEKYGKTAYLLGGTPVKIQKAESNIKFSFPKLNIIGRCAGYFNKAAEKDVILSIRKASPALLVASKGIPGKSKWIIRNRDKFNPGVYVWFKDGFDIFSGKKPRPARSITGRKMEKIKKIFSRPWRIFYIFLYLWFFLLLIYYKIKEK